MVNVLTSIVETHTKFAVGDSFDHDSLVYTFGVTYHDLASMMGYNQLDSKAIYEIDNLLNNLSKAHAQIFYTDGDDRYIEQTTFILKYSRSSTIKNLKRDLNKRFSITVDTTFVRILRENKDLFKQMYNHARFNLKNKYSTILFDTFVDRATPEAPTLIKLSIDELIGIVDIDLEENTNFESWSKISTNIVTRAVKDIIKKTSMGLKYRQVKDSISNTNRLTVVGVEFEVSVATENDEIRGFFREEFLLDRQIEYYIEKEVNKNLSKLKNFKDIKSEENYRFVERKKHQKNREEFKAKVLIQRLVNWIKYNNPSIQGLVCLSDYEGHNLVAVYSDHTLVDVDTQEVLSMNALDTYEKINSFLEAHGEYDFAPVPNRQEYSISHTKG